MSIGQRHTYFAWATKYAFCVYRTNADWTLMSLEQRHTILDLATSLRGSVFNLHHLFSSNTYVAWATTYVLRLGNGVRFDCISNKCTLNTYVAWATTYDSRFGNESARKCVQSASYMSLGQPTYNLSCGQRQIEHRSALDLFFVFLRSILALC